MEKIKHLKENGLFDARVPRYTSYPPANHFQNEVGHRKQVTWLTAVPSNTSISLYVHIPFCKRLCWFCACRTQGTKTLRPVDAYVEFIKRELIKVRESLPEKVNISRLHLGGGTPTILSPVTMQSLLKTVFDEFKVGPEFEFSVEIDPTEASDELLKVLINNGMNRASIGVQDFSKETQSAIGRLQSVAETRHVIDFLRQSGLPSLNLDLLYGLPHQTTDTFRQTLSEVQSMHPDRLAIYGYAHVPWMSKRQVMINEDDLPGSMKRFELSEIARKYFVSCGYKEIGIDHFALPSDSLSKANDVEALRRNFQGYTDDDSSILIGIGASAISHFPQGYVQNAPATSAYQERIGAGGLAGHKGYEMSTRDKLIAKMVEELMCYFALNRTKLFDAFPDETFFIEKTISLLAKNFTDSFLITSAGLELRENAKPLARIIAKYIDDFSCSGDAHSSAI